MWKITRPSLERRGHDFSGDLYCTEQVMKLPPNELFGIVFEIRNLLERFGTVDHIQIFRNQETGRQIYCVSNCSREERFRLLNHGGISIQAFRDQVHWTMCFGEEY